MTKTDAFPTLLSKTDAMIYAADRLEKLVGTLKLIELTKKVTSGVDRSRLTPAERENLEYVAQAASGIIDADVQERAMLAAAREIRAMAHETKLAEARAAANGIGA